MDWFLYHRDLRHETVNITELHNIFGHCKLVRKKLIPNLFSNKNTLRDLGDEGIKTTTIMDKIFETNSSFHVR